jgi:hypothetical protein
MSLVTRILAGLMAATLALAEGLAQESPARPRPDSDVPPPIDQLLTPSSRGPGIDQPVLGRGGPTQGRVANWTVWCKHGDLSCDDLLGFAAGRMWTKIRQCWTPPSRPVGKSVVTTAIRFGADGKSAQPPDRTRTVISIVFRLNRDGTLAAHPEPNKAEPTAATQSLVDEAIRAIEHCAPYDMLPSAKYERWREVFVRIEIADKAAPGGSEAIRGKAP